MKHLKMLALAAVGVSALMAFLGAGTASASVLCSTTADPCPEGQKVPKGTIIDFSQTSGTSSVDRETGVEGETLDTCKSTTYKGELTNAGAGGINATAKITELVLKECTFPTTITQLGKFEIKKIAGTSNGTILADELTKMTINTIFFGTCSYGVESGKSTGDLTEGKPAVLHINAVTKKQEGSALACPETAVWTATYTLTAPSNTTISVSEA